MSRPIQLELFPGQLYLSDEIRRYVYNAAHGCPCADCGEATMPRHWYIVADEVWRSAGMTPVGFLCVGCLERRIGRRLVASDFTDGLINNPNPLDSERLRAAKQRREAVAA